MPIIVVGPATLSSVRFDALPRIRYESEHFSRSLGPPYFLSRYVHITAGILTSRF